MQGAAFCALEEPEEDTGREEKVFEGVGLMGRRTRDSRHDRHCFQGVPYPVRTPVMVCAIAPAVPQSRSALSLPECRGLAGLSPVSPLRAPRRRGLGWVLAAPHCVAWQARPSSVSGSVL